MPTTRQNRVRPTTCARSTCIAMAKRGSQYCPPHIALHVSAERAALDKLVGGRRRRGAKRKTGDPQAPPWLPFSPDDE